MSTVGRPPRKRAKNAGSAVQVSGHTRSPRGNNKGKKTVHVHVYKRGTPKKKSSKPK